jgi:hypothetical protein
MNIRIIKNPLYVMPLKSQYFQRINSAGAAADMH